MKEVHASNTTNILHINLACICTGLLSALSFFLQWNHYCYRMRNLKLSVGSTLSKGLKDTERSIKPFLDRLFYRGVRVVCKKNSEKIWNAWKDVLFKALKVWKWGFVMSKKAWNHIKIWTLTSPCSSRRPVYRKRGAETYPKHLPGGGARWAWWAAARGSVAGGASCTAAGLGQRDLGVPALQLIPHQLLHLLALLGVAGLLVLSCKNRKRRHQGV